MASIEGRRGEPRPRPPFPAQSGLWNKPSNINNVETWFNVPVIINMGSKWFSSIGSEKSKGTKVFSLVGKVNRSGLVEIPFGTSMENVIYSMGGGVTNGRRFKAVQTGGPSGGCIPAEQIKSSVDYETLKALGSIVGSGGLVVMDEDTCMVDVAKFFLDFIVNESCGKCTPCRIGTKRMYEAVERITRGEQVDIADLEELAGTIQKAALCGLGQTAPNPVLTTLRYFRDEYEAHIDQRKCPAKVCKDLIRYRISEDKCTGCTLCMRRCPQGAIVGERRKLHWIQQEKCIKCGLCYDSCSFGAVEKE
jgi:NADP-reducing hydrogenase subunit HndC